MHLPRPSRRRIRFNYLQTTRVLGKQAPVGVRLIVLVLRSDGAKRMSDPVEEQATSDLVHLVVAGETSAFDVILKRYNRDLVLRAETYIRRLRLYAPLYEGQEAVDDAVMAMCQRARRGDLRSIQDSAVFWRALFVELKRAIRRTRDHFNAQGRNARSGGGMSPRRRE